VPALVYANRERNVPRPERQPMPSLTTAPGGGVYFVSATTVEPTMSLFPLGQNGGAELRPDSEPIPTILGGGAIGPAVPCLLLPPNAGNRERTTAEPLPTVVSIARIGLVDAKTSPVRGTTDGTSSLEMLDTYNGEKNGEPRAPRSLDEPIHTLTAEPHFALVRASTGGTALDPNTVYLLSRHRDNGSVRLQPLDSPLPTATRSGGGYLVRQAHTPAPFMTANLGERDGQSEHTMSVEDPMWAVTSRGASSLIEPVVMQTDQTGARSARSSPSAVTKPDAREPGAGPHRSVWPNWEAVRTVEEPTFAIPSQALATATTTEATVPLTEGIQNGEPVYLQLTGPLLYVVEDGVLKNSVGSVSHTRARRAFGRPRPPGRRPLRDRWKQPGSHMTHRKRVTQEPRARGDAADASEPCS
jgi:hypothetical protein